MKNITVNGKKIGKGASLNNNTLLTGLDVMEVKRKVEKIAENVFAELENDWNLEEKGETHRKITQELQNREDYLVFKLKPHVTYVENGQVIKRENLEKNTTRSVEREGTEK